MLICHVRSASAPHGATGKGYGNSLMDRLSKAAAYAGIVAAVAAVLSVAHSYWPLLNQQTPRAPVPSDPESGSKQSVFQDFGNPLSGTGCDTQCLPVFFRVKSAHRDGTADIEIYNQAFGITDVEGIVRLNDGSLSRFSAGYIPGRHSQYDLELIIPGLSVGSKFSVCMNGKMEGRDLPITWRASYQFNRERAENIARLSPVEMTIGRQAVSCQ